MFSTLFLDITNSVSDIVLCYIIIYINFLSSISLNQNAKTCCYNFTIEIIVLYVSVKRLLAKFNVVLLCKAMLCYLQSYCSHFLDNNCFLCCLSIILLQVDGDTSTNDTVIALASGLSGLGCISSLDCDEAIQLQACLDAVKLTLYNIITIFSSHFNSFLLNI